ncbi:endonuclease III [Candidatus Woesearchaeota archaeon]|nr:endonuclease III [Candidatus Woesearchaeota archaeon]
MTKKSKALKTLHELKKFASNLRLAAEDWDVPWKNLISTMLSARTRDEVTIKVCNTLFKKYPTAKALANANLASVKKIIKPVNFYKTKAKNVIACARLLTKKYSGKPPLDFDKLIELPGVGRKTVNVFLSEMGKDEIGVDTHVFQLSRKLGWTKNTKPELIEADLKKLFPKKYWREINPVLVRFGRTYRGKKKDEILEKILLN